NALRGTTRRAMAPALLATTTLGAAACGISQQQELEIGQQYASQINRELPLVEDRDVVRYINQLGNQIARHGGRNLSYRFYVVNTDVINAFAVPGGHVYINRGLIDRTDNLSELAGVLAHEIAHVEARHGVEQMEKAQTANLGLNVAYILLGRTPGGLESAAINVGGGLYFAQHGREAEREADAMAVPLMVNAGIHPQGLATFFFELLAERKRSPNTIEQWFSTHPLTEERIEAVRADIARIPSGTLSRLQTNSRQYTAIKADLRNYPAPPPEYRANR
ncbi:MAG TPA: M48 family metallopeptidase, partial [Longimicrobiales bacterium]|nr:M48 family metallopeptidase [Longimicrobiales bacterium]